VESGGDCHKAAAACWAAAMHVRDHACTQYHLPSAIVLPQQQQKTRPAALHSAASMHADTQPCCSCCCRCCSASGVVSTTTLTAVPRSAVHMVGNTCKPVKQPWLTKTNNPLQGHQGSWRPSSSPGGGVLPTTSNGLQPIHQQTPCTPVPQSKLRAATGHTGSASTRSCVEPRHPTPAWRQQRPNTVNLWSNKARSTQGASLHVRPAAHSIGVVTLQGATRCQ
jgi:hypothetical protein